MAALVAPGAEISRAATARHVPRHHHLSAYAAVLLRGSYVEAGDRGRFRAEAGDVLIHDGFEAHQDDFAAGGADILNIPLADAPRLAFGRVADADAVARAAERDSGAAVALLIETLSAGRPRLSDWPDLLADALRAGDVEDIGGWAQANGLIPSSVSRGFRRCYGVSPKRFRLELRAARAARDAARRHDRLASVAAGAGFADQAHMCRTLKCVYGRSPSALRRAKYVQDGAEALF